MENEIEISQMVGDLIASLKRIGPENAFGNEVLIRSIRHINEHIHLLETTDPCAACDGKGKEVHDCGCEHCSTEWIECEKCFGTGRIEKNDL